MFSNDRVEENALAGVIVDLGRAHRDDGVEPLAFPFPYPHPLHWKTTASAVADILDRLCRSGASDAEQAVAAGGRRWRSRGADDAG